MIEVLDLRKIYRAGKVAVDGLSFTACRGLVTGFLGPNGAGKTTTMRAIAGLERPTSGRVLVDGLPLTEHRAPMSALGLLLDAKAVHPGRTVRQHLRALAATCAIPRRQVDEVLELVGLSQSADRRIRGLSLGMGQRVGLATALLGNPATVVLDEPLNGLDPEGVLWMRRLVRALAGEGRAVLISSHLMSEMTQTADHVVVIGRGRLLADESMESFMNRTGPRGLIVRSPEVQGLLDLLRDLLAAVRVEGGEASVTAEGGGQFRVVGISPSRLGEAAAARRVRLHELTPVKDSLEDVFMALTSSEREYRAAVAPGLQRQPA